MTISSRGFCHQYNVRPIPLATWIGFRPTRLGRRFVIELGEFYLRGELCSPEQHRIITGALLARSPGPNVSQRSGVSRGSADVVAVSFQEQDLPEARRGMPHAGRLVSRCHHAGQDDAARRRLREDGRHGSASRGLGTHTRNFVTPRFVAAALKAFTTHQTNPHRGRSGAIPPGARSASAFRDRRY